MKQGFHNAMLWLNMQLRKKLRCLCPPGVRGGAWNMQMCCRPARPQTACSPHEVMVLWDVWEDTARRPLTRACCLAQADHIGPSFHFQSVLTRVISCLSDSSRFGNGGTYPNTKPRSMRRSAIWPHSLWSEPNLDVIRAWPCHRCVVTCEIVPAKGM